MDFSRWTAFLESEFHEAANWTLHLFSLGDTGVVLRCRKLAVWANCRHLACGRVYSALTPAALMVGHHLTSSDF
jgi:hypothetical protein